MIGINNFDGSMEVTDGIEVTEMKGSVIMKSEILPLVPYSFYKFNAGSRLVKSLLQNEDLSSV